MQINHAHRERHHSSDASIAVMTQNGGKLSVNHTRTSQNAVITSVLGGNVTTLPADETV